MSVQSLHFYEGFNRENILIYPVASDNIGQNPSSSIFMKIPIYTSVITFFLPNMIGRV